MAVTHVSFPGIGKLRVAGKGCDWLPVNYSAQPLSRADPSSVREALQASDLGLREAWRWILRADED